MVPLLENQSLLSGEKFAEARYLSVYDGDKFNIYVLGINARTVIKIGLE